jgi:hypothetical protein
MLDDLGAVHCAATIAQARARWMLDEGWRKGAILCNMGRLKPETRKHVVYVYVI